MNKVVILGATSGIAQALQRLMAGSGKEMVLVGRSQERLNAVEADLVARGAGHVSTLVADLSDSSQHERIVHYAAERFGGFDTLVAAYGSMLDQEATRTSPEVAIQQVNTDFTSAVSLLTLFGEYFRERRSGTIAVITSVAGDRGRRPNYVYGAAKGGLSIFLQGLRSRLHPYGVRVVTIKPGPVDTPMTAQMKKSAIFAKPAKVAGDIFKQLTNGRAEIVYTPWYWRWIMLMLRMVPERSFKKMSV